jgi:polyphenol oxidase
MIEAENLAGCVGIRHGFLTRKGGVSRGLFASLNCGLGTTDAPADIAENRRRAVQAIGLQSAPIVTAYQIHSATVAIVEEPWDENARPRVDALVTRRTGVVLGILTADCAPVLFADAASGIVAAAHAGWKGALGGVLTQTVRAMENLGASRRRIVAAIGPCIGAGSYEVGPEFPAPFIAKDKANARFFQTADACRKFTFDLAGYCEAELAGLGLASITAAGRDTCAEEADFFSYRRMTKRKEADYGRQISLIGLG